MGVMVKDVRWGVGGDDMFVVMPIIKNSLTYPTKNVHQNHSIVFPLSFLEGICYRGNPHQIKHCLFYRL